MLHTLIEFCILIILQALLINGVHECCRGACVEDIHKGRVCSGNIFYMLNPEWFEINKHKNWAKPVFACTKCQSSLWCTITFWPYAVSVYGFHYAEILVWGLDMFATLPVAWLIYKKL